MRSTHLILLSVMVLSSTLTKAEDLLISFDASNAHTYELIEPLRQACIRRALERGATAEVAIGQVPGCVQ